jgi:hypothetical protein
LSKEEHQIEFRWSCALHCTQSKSLGFSYKISFGVNVCGIDLTESGADGVDVNAAAKKMRGFGMA